MDIIKLHPLHLNLGLFQQYDTLQEHLNLEISESAIHELTCPQVGQIKSLENDWNSNQKAWPYFSPLKAE